MNKKVKIVLIVAAVIILAEVVLTGTLLVVKHNAENSYAQHLELAQKYLEDGDYEEAIAEFEAAIEIQPKQTDAYTGLADAYIAMGDYESAVDILNEGYEATGERTVRRKLKSTQELMASAAEATAETAEAESTENAEQTAEAEAVEAVSAEASSDDYYYAAATSMTKAAVEEYAGNVRNLFIQHKWSNLAGMIEFPITIDGITYDSIASFIQGGLDDIYSEDFMSALEAEDCVDMYCTSDGIVLGNSNVVIAEVEKNGASALKIVGVSGLIDEEKIAEEEEDTSLNWAKAYYDYVVDTYEDYYDWDRNHEPDYFLIYLDDDDIPELVIRNNVTGIVNIFAYYGVNVKELIEMQDYIVQYSPFTGWIHYWDGDVHVYYKINAMREMEYMADEKWVYYCDLNGNGVYDAETEIDVGDFGDWSDIYYIVNGTLPPDNLEWEELYSVYDVPIFLSYTEILAQLREMGNF